MTRGPGAALTHLCIAMLAFNAFHTPSNPILFLTLARHCHSLSYTPSRRTPPPGRSCAALLRTSLPNSKWIREQHPCPRPSPSFWRRWRTRTGASSSPSMLRRRKRMMGAPPLSARRSTPFLPPRRPSRRSCRRSGASSETGRLAPCLRLSASRSRTQGSLCVRTYRMLHNQLRARGNPSPAPRRGPRRTRVPQGRRSCQPPSSSKTSGRNGTAPCSWACASSCWLACARTRLRTTA